MAGDGNNLFVLNPICIVEVHPQIDAKRIFVAEDFAIQQHGTFDMAFVVQPGGKVSLLTLKAPEVGPEGAGNTMPEARFMEVGEFWLPPPTNEARGEDAPFVSIKDMAFDPSRFLAYASTLDTLYPSISPSWFPIIAPPRTGASTQLWHRHRSSAMGTMRSLSTRRLRSQLTASISMLRIHRAIPQIGRSRGAASPQYRSLGRG